MLHFLSTSRIEREHPVRINHALHEAHLAVAPFGTSNSTHLFTHSRYAVKLRPLQFNWDKPLWQDFFKRLKNTNYSANGRI